MSDKPTDQEIYDSLTEEVKQAIEQANANLQRSS